MHYVSINYVTILTVTRSQQMIQCDFSMQSFHLERVHFSSIPDKRCCMASVADSGGRGEGGAGMHPPHQPKKFCLTSWTIHSFCNVIIQKFPKIQNFYINFNKIFWSFIKDSEFFRSSPYSKPVVFSANSVCYAIV